MVITDSDPVDLVASVPRPRETSMTRWETLAEHLRDQIRSGHIQPGELLPSYAQIQEQHGISYGTVRQALWVLRMEGWVAGEPGVGVRVRADHPA